MRQDRSENNSYRRLANRRLAVAWKCWQTATPYDETNHWQHVVYDGVAVVKYGSLIILYPFVRG